MNPVLRAILTILVLGCVVDYAHGGTPRIELTEASGIARLGDKLIIVGDDADGRYFELPLDGRSGPVIPVNPTELKEVRLPGAEMAMDLESVDVLSDGRIAILSEQQRCLIARESALVNTYTVIAEYDRMFSEFGNKGLEGIAVTKGDNGASKVAVLWEGGYPEYDLVPEQLRDLVGRLPLKPVIVVHEIARDGRVGLVDDPVRTITLEVPEPPGDVPEVQRFRGSDLVWHRWHEDSGEGAPAEGFIVLISSQNSPPEGSDTRREYRFKQLQRFDLDGKPVGDPLDLTELCSTILGQCADELDRSLDPAMSSHMKKVIEIIDESQGEAVNWEGLGWFVEGESLMAIYDTWPKDPPFVMIFDIPAEWK